MIMDSSWKGLPLSDMLIIDAHAHMGPWYNFPIYGDSSARGMVKLMDRMGVDKCICSAHLSIGPDYREGNEIIYQAMKEFPARILGYCVVNPHYPEEMIPELEKRFLQGFSGIKLHPMMHQYKVSEKNYQPVWEFAKAHRVPLLSHTCLDDSFCKHGLFSDLAKNYPAVPILLGHSGAGLARGYEEAMEVARKYDNVYLEICYSTFSQRWLVQMVNKAGEDKIIFGTDFPFVDPRYTFGRVIFSHLSDRIKEKILGLNIKRILRKK